MLIHAGNILALFMRKNEQQQLTCNQSSGLMNGNAFAVGSGGPRFKSRSSQI